MPINQLPDNIQHWTAQRRAALILSILKGETSIAEAECESRSMGSFGRSIRPSLDGLRAVVCRILPHPRPSR